MNSRRSILLVEDNETLSSGLVEHLQDQFYILSCKTIAASRTALAGNEKFDLAIVDIFLPDGSGIDLARSVLIPRDVPVVFLSAFSSAEYRLEALEAGGADFVPKPFHLRELLLRLERVLEQRDGRRISEKQQSVINEAGVQIDLEARTVRSGESQSVLSVKDAALLAALIACAPKARSREELATEVWGEQGGVTARTIDNAVVRLRQALGAAADALVSVRGIGYQWRSGNVAQTI